jgi:hypothetical protein
MAKILSLVDLKVTARVRHEHGLEIVDFEPGP